MATAWKFCASSRVIATSPNSEVVQHEVSQTTLAKTPCIPHLPNENTDFVRRKSSQTCPNLPKFTLKVCNFCATNLITFPVHQVRNQHQQSHQQLHHPLQPHQILCCLYAIQQQSHRFQHRLCLLSSGSC